MAFVEQSLVFDHSVPSPPSPAELASNQVSLRSTVSILSATAWDDSQGMNNMKNHAEPVESR